MSGGDGRRATDQFSTPMPFSEMEIMHPRDMMATMGGGDTTKRAPRRQSANHLFGFCFDRVCDAMGNVWFAANHVLNAHGDGRQAAAAEWYDGTLTLQLYRRRDG